jgi:hypothetical protein
MRTSSLDRAARCDPSRRPAARSSERADFARHLRGNGAAAATDLSLIEAPAGLMALLDVQEQEGEGRARRRGAALRGAALLDQLERLRVDILDGYLPSDRLIALANAVREHRSRTNEEVLDLILAEIELRAEVEIAKLTRTSKDRPQAPYESRAAQIFAEDINGLRQA